MMTALQQELHEMNVKLNAERDAAMKRCLSPWQRQSCWDAYHRCWRGLSDIIGQRHGLKPMEHRA